MQKLPSGKPNVCVSSISLSLWTDAVIGQTEGTRWHWKHDYTHMLQHRELVPAFIQCCLYDLPSTGIETHIFHIWKIQLYNWEPLSLSCWDVCEIQPHILWEKWADQSYLWDLVPQTSLRLINPIAAARADLMDFIGCGKRDPYLSTHHCFRPNRLSGWIACFLKSLWWSVQLLSCIQRVTVLNLVCELVHASFMNEDRLMHWMRVVHSVLHTSLDYKVIYLNHLEHLWHTKDNICHLLVWWGITCKKSKWTNQSMHLNEYSQWINKKTRLSILLKLKIYLRFYTYARVCIQSAWRKCIHFQIQYTKVHIQNNTFSLRMCREFFWTY